ncbi:MAG: carbohydrate ABC transporter permease, partial [Lachnospiraceae bacterium]|nr:carbohydrate ABC transporter permease [Lachnospiraceae bacterium]
MSKKHATISARKRKELIKIALITIVAAVFAVIFLTPIVLTITNSFMSQTEINANYGAIFARSDKGGKIFISEAVHLKFFPDMVSFSQYITVLFKSPEYLFKFWNSVILV